MDKITPEFWSALLHDVIDLVTPSAADIFTSPAKIGSLLRICAELEALKKEAETAGIALAFKRTDIPGWTLVRRDGSRYIEAETIVSLLGSVPVREFVRVLPEVLSWWGNVSERRYLSLCGIIASKPDRKAIQQSGATVFLRRAPEKDPEKDPPKESQFQRETNS